MCSQCQGKNEEGCSFPRLGAGLESGIRPVALTFRSAGADLKVGATFDATSRVGNIQRLTLTHFGRRLGMNESSQTLERIRKPVTRHFYISVPVVLLASVLVISAAEPQRGFGGRPAPSAHAGWSRFHGTGSTFASPTYARSGLGIRRGGWGYGASWGYSPFSDFYDRGEDYARPDFEPPAPPEPIAYEPPEPVKVIQPILIERQGNAWVQVSGYTQGKVSGLENPQLAGETAGAKASAPGQESSGSRSQLPPATLVFRDGHQEEIKGYTIIGSTLYAKSDFWATGVWTRKVDFAELDVPATLKLNQQNGAPFRLPSGPQEVIIRP
jgi:hypothetical protein